MDNEQIILFLLTLVICCDILEFIFEWKAFRKAIDECNFIYYAAEPTKVGEYPTNSAKLTASNQKVEYYQQKLKNIKLKMMLKMFSKLLVEVLLNVAGIVMIVVDGTILICLILFYCYKNKRA